MGMNQFKIAASLGNVNLLCGVFGNISIGRSNVERQRRLLMADEIVTAFDRHTLCGSPDGSDFNGITMWKIGLADIKRFFRVEMADHHNGHHEHRYKGSKNTEWSFPAGPGFRR